MIIAVMMVVVVALDIGVKQQFAGDKIVNRCISGTAHTAVKLDRSSRKSSLGTCADAAADKHVGVKSGENARKSAVTAAVGVNDLGGYYLSVPDIINFKLLGVAKVLEYHTVFISYSNSHIVISFWFLIFFMIQTLKAAIVLTARITSVAKMKFAAAYRQRQSPYQCRSDLFSGAIVYPLHGSPCHLHQLAALFLRKPFIVDKSYRFILVDSEYYRRSSVCSLFGDKSKGLRIMAYLSALSGSWHRSTSCIIHILRQFRTYVNNIIIKYRLTYDFQSSKIEKKDI